MSARRARLSASGRVLLAMTAMLVTNIILLVVIAYATTARTLTASLDQALRREAEAYAAAMQGAPPGDALTDATRAYLGGRTGAESGGLSPILLARLDNGRVISNSEIRLEDAQGIPGTSTASPTYSFVTFRGDRYRVLTVPVSAMGERVGVFQGALAEGPNRQTAARVATTLTAAGLIALAIALPFAFLATRRALSPLTRMAADAEEISHAEPGGRIEYLGPADELGSLAESLNRMLERLENSYGEQRRFIADASHELRTPVAVVRGNVELLRSGAATGADADESLEMIETEALRMTRLLDELLALARLENAGDTAFQPLDVQVLVDEVVARARALGDRTIECEGRCALWVSGNPDLLDQALVNLVKNAVAHTSDGGTITLACEADATHVRISVTDDGPGIPAAEVERVFDRFYRAHGSTRDAGTGGAGLGLAITKRLIQLHHGRVYAGNVSPHGARFVIELPRAATPRDGAADR